MHLKNKLFKRSLFMLFICFAFNHCSASKSDLKDGRPSRPSVDDHPKPSPKTPTQPNRPTSTGNSKQTSPRVQKTYPNAFSQALGLNNFGNTCHLNVALQLLRFVLQKELSKEGWSRTYEGQNPNLMGLIIRQQKLWDLATKHKEEPINTDQIKTIRDEIDDHLELLFCQLPTIREGRQEDAAETFSKMTSSSSKTSNILSDYLKDKFGLTVKSFNPEHTNVKIDQETMYHIPFNAEIGLLHVYLNGRFGVPLDAPYQKDFAPRFSLQYLIDQSLPLREDYIDERREGPLFSHFLTYLDSNSSSHYKIPESTFLHLARYKHNETDYRLSKINEPITINETLTLRFFKPDLLTLEDHTLPHYDVGKRVDYQVKAAICHRGTTNQKGHYVFYFFDEFEKEWFLANDRLVTQVRKTEALKEISSTGYIFFISH